MEWKTFYIKKRSGGKRRITAPDEKLKKKQKEILKELYKLYYPYYSLKCAYGGMPFRNIKKHANFHIDKDIVLRLDIKDFFDSIEKSKMLNILCNAKIVKKVKKGKVIKEEKIPIKLIKKIEKYCFYDNKLPQGAVTSPFLSNIYMQGFDEAMFALCHMFYYNYSRYFDDMIFSIDKKRLIVARLDGKNDKPADFKQIIAVVKKYLRDNNLKLNYKKTKVMGKSKRQSVCNITVNEKHNINRKYYKMLRAVKHHFLTGREATMTLKEFQGHLSFVRSINPNVYEKLKWW